MPVNLHLDKMSVAEKLRVMEALWENLSRNSDALESPAWHEDELREREERIASGKTKFTDWEKAKAEIRQRVT
jgi:putative addiction module component (TIGR02574 family)